MIHYTVDEAKASFEEMIAHVKAGDPVEVLLGGEVVPLRRGLPESGGLGCMRGRMEFIGDIVAPLDEPWEAAS